jgi:PAS domain S-box-containing protein
MNQNIYSAQNVNHAGDDLERKIYELENDLAAKNKLIAQLNERDEILSIVSELSSDYFFQISLADDSFSIDWIKGKFEEITGFSKDTITSLQKWITFIHPEDVEIVKNATSKILSNQISQTEYRFKCKSGDIKWIRDLTYPVWCDKQKKVTKIIGAVKDITGEKNLKEKLINSEQKFRTLVEKAPNIIVILNSENKIEFLNRTFYGVNPNTVVGKSAFDYVEPGYHDMIKKIHADVFETGKTLMYEVSAEVANGKKNYFETLVGPIENNGKVNKIILISSDISERKKVEEKLLSYSSELKTSNASKDKFFSIIAHDLRSPFTGILGNLEILHDSIDTSSKDEIQMMVGESLTSARNTFSLLINLLEWSRMQTGSFPLKLININLFNLAESTIQLFADTVEKKRIKVEIDIDNKLEVRADENMMLSVFRNLISNAVKFTNEGGLINIFSKSEVDNITVCIEDNGIGIGKEDLKKLFRTDIHYSIPGTDDEKGTGLGLILCNEFIERQRGKIWVESKKNEGSTFYFTLPASN